MSCAPWLSRGVRWRRRDRSNMRTIAEGGGITGSDGYHGRSRGNSSTPLSNSCCHRECEEEKVGSYRKASSLHNKSPFRYVSSDDYNPVSPLHREASSNNDSSPPFRKGSYTVGTEPRYRIGESGNYNDDSPVSLPLKKEGYYECNSNIGHRHSFGWTYVEEGEGRVSSYHRRCTHPTLRPQFSAFSEEEPQHGAAGNDSSRRRERRRKNTEAGATSSSRSSSSSSNSLTSSRRSSRSAAVGSGDNDSTAARQSSNSRRRRERGGGTTAAGKHKNDRNTDSKRGGHTEKSNSSNVTVSDAAYQSSSASSSQKEATAKRMSVLRSTVARRLRSSPRGEVSSPRSDKRNSSQQMETEEEEEVEEEEEKEEKEEEEEEENEKRKKGASARRTSVSRSSGPARGGRQRGSASRAEGGYGTSEEMTENASGVGSASFSNTSQVTGEETPRRVLCEGVGDGVRAGGRGGGGGGGGGEAVGKKEVSANESEESSEGGGKSERLTSGAGGISGYSSRISPVKLGTRRTGRLSERWSSAFHRSRRSTLLSEDSTPVMLPMSQVDWIIVDRLSRKINSSNFATVLKAYLIMKTRVAAQRANKEYSQSQRKGGPGAALRLLLNRQNNRVALRMRAAGNASGGGDEAPTAAEAAANAAAALRVETATVTPERLNESSSVNSRSNSQSGDGASYTSESMGPRSRHSVSKPEDIKEDKAGQQDLAAAVRVAASAGGGSVIGCGVLGETPDVSSASASVAAADAFSSAAGTAGSTQRRELQYRIKGVGVVGRMQAHQNLLEQRLAFLGLRSVYINGDGNCLFRSCSYNLYGTEEHHRYVRLHATQHMRSAAHQKDYSIFFERESEFDTYLKNMQRLGTWGDELCVRAIADSFECTIHIITSTDSNWYLRYDPQTERPPVCEEGKEEEEKNRDREGSAEGCGTNSSCGVKHGSVASSKQHGTALKHIFLTYISPIHYNAFTIAEVSACGSQSE